MEHLNENKLKLKRQIVGAETGLNWGTRYAEKKQQHNVHITSSKYVPEEKKKMLEPLFMAVSSFIGMAVMFILSILFLPKFGGTKRNVVVDENADITTLAQVVLKAIEGHDCSERIICEIGKTAKAFNINENRFIKLFQRIAPESVAWYVNKIRKHAQTKRPCAAVQCRTKIVPQLKLPKRFQRNLLLDY